MPIAVSFSDTSSPTVAAFRLCLFGSGVVGPSLFGRPSRTMARRSGRDVRIAPNHLWLRRPNTECDTIRRRPVHHIRLLVHRLNLIRQPGRDDCTLAFGYFCRYRACRSSCVHRGAAGGSCCCCGHCTLVMGETSLGVRAQPVDATLHLRGKR